MLRISDKCDSRKFSSKECKRPYYVWRNTFQNKGMKIFLIKFTNLFNYSKGMMPLYVNLCGIKSDCTNKTSVHFKSREVSLQNCGPIFRYSHRLLCNFSLKFSFYNFTDTGYVGNRCWRLISKQKYLTRVFRLLL